MGDVITDREKFEKGWHGGLPETPCGYGSRVSQTVAQREWIPRIAEQYGVRTVADLGAGDLNWMQRVHWPAGVTYAAYDLVPRHPSVQPLDLTAQVAPRSDLLLCLWVLNHLPLDAARAAWANLNASGSRYLMLTDRPKWHHEQPAEFQRLKPIEELLLRPDTGDRIILVSLPC